MFVKNCIGCSDCFMSTNLIQKQYYIFNKPYSKEEYFKKLKEYDLGSRKVIQDLKKDFQKICQNSLVKYYVGHNIENSTGSYLVNCKNCTLGFDLDHCEDVTYGNNIQRAKNSMDYSYWGENAELMYECQACGYDVYNLQFCNLCWSGCHDMQYCDNSFSSNNCFGCTGMRKDQYCILNKQYSKEEYENLVPRIIQHMKQTSEYGEFFPISYSPFAYNESLAWEHLQLPKEDVLTQGWQWKDKNQEYEYHGSQTAIPDRIQDVTPHIIDKILTCTSSGQFYKIIPQELKFYKEQELPLPAKCPDQRHFDRMALRNPRKLWERACAKCRAPIQTTYSPDRPETVYCEKCYLQAVY